MDKQVETYNLPRLNQEEKDKLRRLITSTEIEAVIKKLPARKSSRLESFTGVFYQTYKEDLIPILLKLF